jgi:hypothetical protein
LFPSTGSSSPPLTFIYFFYQTAIFLAPLPCYDDINIYLSSSLIYYFAVHRSDLYYANIYIISGKKKWRPLLGARPPVPEPEKPTFLLMSLKNQPFTGTGSTGVWRLAVLAFYDSCCTTWGPSVAIGSGGEGAA